MSVHEQQDQHSPWLSVIVATYRAGATLPRCLHSVTGQDFGGWELLIADGGSDDNTVEVIRQHAQHIAWWRSGKDNGIYDAWNDALLRANGEYVCFLGADDSFADSKALARLHAAVGREEYDLVTSRGSICDPSRGKAVAYGGAWDYGRLGRRMVVCHPGLLHRRSLFHTHGLFDTQYRIAGDLEFLLRLPENIRTLHVNSTSVVIEAGGISRRQVLARLREQREILSRCERYGPVRAYLAWADKLVRLPIARILNIPH